MIEASGEVLAARDGYAWVGVRSMSECAPCRAGQGCGRALLAGLGGEGDRVVKAVNRPGAAVGDAVTVELEEGVVMAVALWLYAVPLAGLTAGAVLAHWIAGGDAATLAGAGLGLIVSLASTRGFARRAGTSGQWEPVISPRRVEADMPRC